MSAKKVDDTFTEDLKEEPQPQDNQNNTQSYTSSHHQEISPQNKPRKGKILSYTAGVLLLAGAGGFLGYKLANRDTAKEEPTSTEYVQQDPVQIDSPAMDGTYVQQPKEEQMKVIDVTPENPEDRKNTTTEPIEEWEPQKVVAKPETQSQNEATQQEKLEEKTKAPQEQRDLFGDPVLLGDIDKSINENNQQSYENKSGREIDFLNEETNEVKTSTNEQTLEEQFVDYQQSANKGRETGKLIEQAKEGTDEQGYNPSVKPTSGKNSAEQKKLSSIDNIFPGTATLITKDLPRGRSIAKPLIIEHTSMRERVIDGTYIVDEPISIGEDEILHIVAGSELYFAEKGSLFVAQGDFIGTGTEQAPIIFAPYNNDQKLIECLRITNSDNSSIENLYIVDFKQQGGELWIENSSVELTNLIMTNNHSEHPLASIILLNSTINANNMQAHYNTSKKILLAMDSKGTINNCRFSNNTVKENTIFISNPKTRNTHKFRLQNMNINNNESLTSNTGLYALYANLEVSKVNIHHNHANQKVGGMYINKTYLKGNRGDLLIHNNTSEQGPGGLLAIGIKANKLFNKSVYDNTKPNKEFLEEEK